MKYKPINDYTTHYDLFQKLGIREYKPKIGNLGRAIMEASRTSRSVGWLKKQLDVYFDKLRSERSHGNKKDRNENGRRNKKPLEMAVKSC